MIKKFISDVSKIFIKKQGIKKVMLGDKKIYERTGGFLYITLENKE